MSVGKVRVVRGGDVIESVKVARALGSAQRPISADALRQKFVDCFAKGGPQVDAVALFDRLDQFNCVASVRDLFDAAEATWWGSSETDFLEAFAAGCVAESQT